MIPERTVPGAESRHAVTAPRFPPGILLCIVTASPAGTGVGLSSCEVLMQVVYARQDHANAARPALFLAGPTPRSPEVPSWRPDALRLLDELLFPGTVFIPEAAGTGGLSTSYEDQVRWEWACLERADAIAFWVPRELKTLPGFITNIEFGLYCRSGKVLLGYPSGAPKMRYLHLLAGAWNIPVFHDLSDLLRSAVARLCEAGRTDFRESVP